MTYKLSVDVLNYLFHSSLPAESLSTGLQAVPSTKYSQEAVDECTIYYVKSSLRQPCGLQKDSDCPELEGH